MPIPGVALASTTGTQTPVECALRLVERLDLDRYPYLHSTPAELLRRLGRTDEAQLAFRRALDLTRIEPERRFLRRRLDQL